MHIHCPSSPFSHQKMLAARNGLQASTSLIGSMHKSASAASRICVTSSSSNSIGSTSSIFKRHSHIGSEPLYISPSTKLTIQPFPPMINPSRRQPLEYLDGSVKSIKVQGPLGTVIVPLRDFVELNWDESQTGEEAEQKKLSLSVKDANVKVQKGTWGLTRALLANAIEGVQEGHSISIQMVGVGYRALVEKDPFPRLDKFEDAFAKMGDHLHVVKDGKIKLEENLGPLGNFVSEAQRVFYHTAILRSNEELKESQRLSLRLGYSHPIFMPIPRGITCLTPQPTRIVLKGADKEALGLFAAKIRKLRPPEPYKGKGVFVGDETIKLKAARKK